MAILVLLKTLVFYVSSRYKRIIEWEEIKLCTTTQSSAMSMYRATVDVNNINLTKC